MQNILVTGGAGFIGSAFVRHMVTTYPGYQIVVFDKLTYAGNLDNLLPVQDAPNYAFLQGDIAEEADVMGALETYNIDTIVNFAAESHVDRSILSPHAFIMTDVVGSYMLLECARKLGIGRVHQVSTDEVYGTIPEGLFKEGDPLEPNSPYAASKAGGELMLRAYKETYGMHTTVTRGSNTFGPYQYPEKLAPFFITEAIDNRPLPLYGDGLQVRDWLHVDDHAYGVDLVLHKGQPGEIYNIGGENERTNRQITDLILETLGKPESLVRYVEDRPGHDRRYALTNDKLRADFGWAPSRDFETAMRETITWYANNEWWWRKIKDGDYIAFYQQQYAERLAKANAEND
ncbi:MAG: dTDP-glucose 4,6-dehydratase [Anaerolineales bacterium]